jgi:hypothetical protein
MSSETTIAIGSIKGFTKLGEFKLNKTSSKPLFKFIKCSGFTKCKCSHIYLIVVDDQIYKVGGSTQELVKYAGYGCGNGGSPSKRTTGIHYYIAKELYDGKEVSFWYMLCPVVKCNYTNIFGISYEISFDANPKIFEEKVLDDISSKYHKLPIWNKQEQGRKQDWETSITKIFNAITRKEVILPSDDDTNVIMKLYHWKYNDISLDT